MLVIHKHNSKREHAEVGELERSMSLDVPGAIATERRGSGKISQDLDDIRISLRSASLDTG